MFNSGYPPYAPNQAPPQINGHVHPQGVMSSNDRIYLQPPQNMAFAAPPPPANPPNRTSAPMPPPDFANKGGNARNQIIRRGLSVLRNYSNYIIY